MIETLNPPALPKVSDREKLDRFTAAALAAKEYHVEMPVKHWFTPGLYVRQIHVPAGTIVVTRIHKTEHPFVLSQGECEVWCPDKGWQRIKAPFTGITFPGTQRLVLCHGDVVWTTFHPGPWAPDTDPDIILNELSTMPDLTTYLAAAPVTVLDALRSYLPAIEGGSPL